MPRPQHFLVRPQTTSAGPGPIVPLIAVDQLPEWFDIQGVGRELRVEQTVDMVSVGVVPLPAGRDPARPHGHMYDIRLRIDSDPFQPSAAATAEVPAARQRQRAAAGLAASMHASPPDSGAGVAGPESRPHLLDAPHRPPSRHGRPAVGMGPSPHASPRAAASVPLLARTNSTPTTAAEADSGAPITPTLSAAGPVASAGTSSGPPTPDLAPDGPRIAYCRHWCHHGTCKWGYACRFSHRMPTTAEELNGVGLSGFPDWWNAAAEFFAAGMTFPASGALPNAVSQPQARAQPSQPPPPPQQQKPGMGNPALGMTIRMLMDGAAGGFPGQHGYHGHHGHPSGANVGGMTKKQRKTAEWREKMGLTNPGPRVHPPYAGVDAAAVVLPPQARRKGSVPSARAYGKAKSAAKERETGGTTPLAAVLVEPAELRQLKAYVGIRPSESQPAAEQQFSEALPHAPEKQSVQLLDL